MSPDFKTRGEAQAALDKECLGPEWQTKVWGCTGFEAPSDPGYFYQWVATKGHLRLYCRGPAAYRARTPSHETGAYPSRLEALRSLARTLQTKRKSIEEEVESVAEEVLDAYMSGHP